MKFEDTSCGVLNVSKRHLLNDAMKKLAQIFIKVYQILLSPVLGLACRFEPTCSEYAYQAITAHGVIKGGWLSIKRIMRCHPFHPGGYDPVP